MAIVRFSAPSSLHEGVFGNYTRHGRPALGPRPSAVARRGQYYVHYTQEMTTEDWTAGGLGGLERAGAAP